LLIIFALKFYKIFQKVHHNFKSAKIYFCFAVLLMVAKPFLGFTMISRMHPPIKGNIFVKSFTKRKLEYSENSSFNMDTVQKKLADPVKQVIILFSCLLGILFPVLLAGKNITDRFLNEIQLSLSHRRDTYLLNCNLLI
jgi:hypothetical protein